MVAKREIIKVFMSQPVIEGAGVHLRRAFGYHELPAFDPFLLLDDFRSDSPESYIKGFPWHPHRGIETITYVLDGVVEHSDSLGNKGAISSGDIQWMTAGSGIIHQEMPKGTKDGKMHGFQLWANLPAENKMMRPRYQDIPAKDVPAVDYPNGVKIKILCGELDGVAGPVKDIIIDPQYWDVAIPVGQPFVLPTKPGHTCIVYVIAGSGVFGSDTSGNPINQHKNSSLLLFGDGDCISALAGPEGLRFLFISGKPIGEPIAWQGPIVMNTREELILAFEEFNKGEFLKK